MQGCRPQFRISCSYAPYNLLVGRQSITEFADSTRIWSRFRLLTLVTLPTSRKLIAHWSIRYANSTIASSVSRVRLAEGILLRSRGLFSDLGWIRLNTWTPSSAGRCGDVDCLPSLGRGGELCR